MSTRIHLQACALACLSHTGCGDDEPATPAPAPTEEVAEETPSIPEAPVADEDDDCEHDEPCEESETRTEYVYRDSRYLEAE